MDKYTWCRLEGARDCERKDPHAHISIQSPGASPIRLRCNSSGLWLYFIDLNPREIMRTKAASKDPKKAKELATACMSAKQAHDIITFVEDHPCPIVVNCEAGISRSPAVVMALRDWYEGSILSVLKYAVPNMHVAFTLATALRVRGVA